jgi:hypothetical protein
MSDIIRDVGQASNSGASSEDHLTKSGEPDKRFKEVSPVVLLCHPHALACSDCYRSRQHGGGTHGNQGGRLTGFEEIGDGTSSMRTEGTGEDTGTYK